MDIYSENKYQFFGFVQVVPFLYTNITDNTNNLRIFVPKLRFQSVTDKSPCRHFHTPILTTENHAKREKTRRRKEHRTVQPLFPPAHLSSFGECGKVAGCRLVAFCAHRFPDVLCSADGDGFR